MTLDPENSGIPSSLPCIACGRSVSVEAQDGVFQWTNDGIWMLETGNYGSAELDDPGGGLAVFMVLCDRCLVARRDRMRAVKIGSESKRTDGWEWLEVMPEHLIRKGCDAPSQPPVRSFRCSCNLEVSGLGVTSAYCVVHGPMPEGP